MPTNDFKPFASAASANVLSQQAYLALPALLTGFSSGTAWSPQLNKVWRQASLIAAMIGQFSVDQTGQDFIDDGTIPNLEATFVAAIQRVIQSTSGRTRLTADLDIYVSMSGDDTRGGTSTSTAIRTIQQALNLAYFAYDVGIYSVKIHLAPGTYGPFVAVGNNFGKIYIVGDVNNPSNYVIDGTPSSPAAAACFNSAVITLEGVKITSAYNAGVYASNNGLVYLKKVEFGSCASSHISADNSGRVEVLIIDSYTNRYPYLITGPAPMHLFAASQAFIQAPYSNVTVSNSPAFGTSFAYAAPFGKIDVGGSVYGGTATGKRYTIDSLGYIETNGGGSSFFPGNVAGTVATLGLYR